MIHDGLPTFCWRSVQPIQLVFTCSVGKRWHVCACLLIGAFTIVAKGQSVEAFSGQSTGGSVLPQVS